MFFESRDVIIRPEKRQGYLNTPNYPRHIIIGHSTRWPTIIKEAQSEMPELSVTSRKKGRNEDEVNFSYKGVPMKYVFAPEGTIGIQTQIIKHSMRGARNFINIGCVGGINPDLSVGSQLVCKEAIRASGFGQLFATADEKAITSESLNAIVLETMQEITNTAVLAQVWCVDTLYYSYAQLQATLLGEVVPDVVEMEMEAGTITAGWLNHNYFPDNQVRYSQIGYISDRVPLEWSSSWKDPFEGSSTKRMIPWKKTSLQIAVEALAQTE